LSQNRLNTHPQRFFIALVPPQEIQDYAREVQQHFADRYNSRAALRSPPHITMQPPFEWSPEALPNLEQYLSEFAGNQAPIPLVLEGFAAFPPRVIFINVLKTPELLATRTALLTHTQSNLGIATADTRPFAPHMTVAFRDLTRSHFKTAWEEFKSRSLQFEFIATHLTLLIHDGKRWQICREFPFSEHQI
jgi:2'-5' RNA ligase